MAKFTANITKVQRNPKNQSQAIVTTSAGHTLWLDNGFIQKVLQGAYMDDCRPTALIDTEISYEMKAHAVGELVFDSKGQVKEGETTTYKTASERPINLTFGDITGHITEFDKAKMNANAIANLYKSVGAAFGVKKAAVAIKEEVPAGDTGEDTI